MFKISFDANSVSHVEQGDYDGAVILNNSDTVYYRVGYFVSNLSDPIPEIVYTNDPLELKRSTDRTVYVSDKHFDADLLRSHNVHFFMSKGHRIKMISPIDTVAGGAIGIYVDSLLATKLGNVRLNMFCEKLTKTSYRSLSNALLNIDLLAWDTSKLKIPYGSYYIQ